MQMIASNSELLSWETYDEDISSLEVRPTVTADGLLEQINVTRDSSDYLWYITRYVLNYEAVGLKGVYISRSFNRLA